MNLEETKKIIDNKIEAEALIRNARSQIKSYIHEKQDERKGFKETFQPLIETQEAVKESIDKEQNAMIEQLQKNKKALTEGLDKNRLAITSGFDKMDEVKRWDLQQLPGFEAIEEPEKEYEEEYGEEYSQEEPTYWISYNDELKMRGREDEIEETGENLIPISKSELDSILSKGKFDQDKYSIISIDPERTILRIVEKDDYNKEPKKGVVTFGASDLDKGLLNKISVDALKELKVPLPSRIKNRKREDIQIFQNSAEVHLDYFKTLLSNKAYFYTEKGVNKAKAKRRNPQKDTEKQIDYYNVLGNYINNISKLKHVKACFEA